MGHYEKLRSSTRPLFKAAATIALGSGYPKCLKGDQIHIFVRITAVVDVFDVLDALLEKILMLFEEQKRQHFDRTLVDILFAHLDELLKISSQF